MSPMSPMWYPPLGPQGETGERRRLSSQRLHSRAISQVSRAVLTERVREV